MPFTPVEMARAIGQGLLSFPVTHFDADNRFDVANYRAHCSWMMQHQLAGLFERALGVQLLERSSRQVTMAIRRYSSC